MTGDGDSASLGPRFYRKALTLFAMGIIPSLVHAAAMDSDSFSGVFWFGVGVFGIPAVVFGLVAASIVVCIRWMRGTRDRRTIVRTAIGSFFVSLGLLLIGWLMFALLVHRS